MGWSEIHAFMCGRDPAFARSCTPVPREDIAACEQGLGITLPAMYVELLATMGAGSGRYRPFGWDQDHDFYGLVGDIGLANYPTDRYFRVSRQIDETIDVIQEPYLDLRRAAGDDTPLITIYEAGPFEPDHVQDLNRSLVEALTLNAFAAFVVADQRHQAAVSSVADTVEGTATLRDAAVAHLTAMGLKPVLPRLPRVVCMLGRELSAQVEVHGDRSNVLAIDLAGDDRSAVRDAAESLAAALPGASLVPRGMRIELP
jgi:hypothetical protein